MSFNSDEFMKEVQKMDKNPKYEAFIGASLPNSGDTVEEICANGMLVLDANIGNLLSAMEDSTTYDK